MTEAEIQSRIDACGRSATGRKAISEQYGNRHRAGRVVERGHTFLTLQDFRPVQFGLCVGSSDLIGWNEQGLFTALEVKTATGRATDQQHNFIRVVNESGGLAGIVRSPDDALALLNIGNRSNANRRACDLTTRPEKLY